jgi:hypothetical protein
MAAALDPMSVSVRFLRQAWDTDVAGLWRRIGATLAMKELIPELLLLLGCRRSL